MITGKAIFGIGGAISTFYGILSAMSWFEASSELANGPYAMTMSNIPETATANAYLILCIAFAIGTILVGIPFLIKEK